MRRSAVVACFLSTQVSTAWAQSPIESTAASNEDPPSLPQPKPGLDLHNAPSQPDPKATRHVTPAKPAELPVLRPATPDVDNLSGHWFLGVAATMGAPLGNFTSKTPIGARLGESYAVGLDLGFGITRNLVIAGAGEYASIAAGNACDACDAKSYVVGPRLRYFLVEGTRFAPFIAYGLSFRRTTYSMGAATRTFDAIEPIRIEMAGDWYLTSKVMIGPILTLGIDKTTSADDSGTNRWSTWLSFGLRFAFDPTGR